MRPNKLRELLRARKPSLGTHIHSAWPATVEQREGEAMRKILEGR
jgi:hypothetical protein